MTESMRPSFLPMVLAIFVALHASAVAQAAFEVASIKENKAPGTGGSLRPDARRGIRAQQGAP